MIIVGNHRSAALAQRHLRELRREHKGSTVEIISRRNASGRYSGRGQYFWFEVTKLPTNQIELVAHFDYSSRKAKRLLRFQVHIIDQLKQPTAKRLKSSSTTLATKNHTREDGKKRLFTGVTRER